MELTESRKEIDEIDHKLLQLIAKRFELCNLISEYKKKNNLEVQDLNREIDLVKDRSSKLSELGFDDPNFVKELFEIILKKSREIQDE